MVPMNSTVPVFVLKNKTVLDTILTMLDKTRIVLFHMHCLDCIQSLKTPEDDTASIHWMSFSPLGERCILKIEN